MVLLSLLLLGVLSSSRPADAAAATSSSADREGGGCPPPTATIVADGSFLRFRRDPNGTRPDGSPIPRSPRGRWDALNVRALAVDAMAETGPADSWAEAEVQLSFAPAGEWWELHGSHLLERGQETGVMLTATTSPIVRLPRNAVFHCEYMELNYVNNNEEAIGKVTMRDFMLSMAEPVVDHASEDHSVEDGPPCAKQIYNPCDDRDDGGEGTVCSSVDGAVSCVAPEDGMLSPLPGLTRGQFHELYWCVEYPPPPHYGGGLETDIDDGLAPTNLYWDGEHAFLQAANATATLADGTAYTFIDDIGRPQIINSGGEGEEVSREDRWVEDGVERRLKFYFRPSGGDTNNFPSTPIAQENGWTLLEARMYDSGAPLAASDDAVNADEDFVVEDANQNTNVNEREYEPYPYPEWITWSGYDGASQIGVPPGHNLFYCDYVEFNFGSWQNGGANLGKFVGRDVFIGAFLGPYPYDVCKMKIFNPCARENGELLLCRAVDGNITCVDPQPQDLTGESVVEMQTSSSSFVGGEDGKLFCEKPEPPETASGEDGKVDVPPITLTWKGQFSFLHASNATVTYVDDGSTVLFEDQDGRRQCIGSGGRGEEIMRVSHWYEDNIQRGLGFYFTALRSDDSVTSHMDGILVEEFEEEIEGEDGEGIAAMASEDAVIEFYDEAGAAAAEEMGVDSHQSTDHYVDVENDDDTAGDDFTLPVENPKGWRLHRSFLYGKSYPYSEHLTWAIPKASTMIEVPSKNHLFHCEYVEFNYVHGDYRRQPAAKFIAYDMVIGGYLKEHYDICDLSLYNPCGGAFCRAVDGIVTCLDGIEDDVLSPALQGRSGSEFIQSLESCGSKELADAVGGDDENSGAVASAGDDPSVASARAIHDVMVALVAVAGWFFAV